MAVSNAVLVASLDLKRVAEQETTLEARLRATMREAHNHWFVTSEEDRFKAAVGAVILVSDDTDRARINREMRALAGVNALMQGLPVDLDSLVEDHPDLGEWIGLRKLWDETK